MTILDLAMIVLAIVVIGVVVYYFIRRKKDQDKHVHKWQYMFSDENMEYNWFYCTICLAQNVAHLDEHDAVIDFTVYPVRPQWKGKK